MSDRGLQPEEAFEFDRKARLRELRHKIQEDKDAASMQEVRKDDSLELLKVPELQSVAGMSRAEEESLSAQADYWNGIQNGES